LARPRARAARAAAAGRAGAAGGRPPRAAAVAVASAARSPWREARVIRGGVGRSRFKLGRRLMIFEI